MGKLDQADLESAMAAYMEAKTIRKNIGTLGTDASATLMAKIERLNRRISERNKIQPHLRTTTEASMPIPNVGREKQVKIANQDVGSMSVHTTTPVNKLSADKAGPQNLFGPTTDSPTIIPSVESDEELELDEPDDGWTLVRGATP